MRPILVTLALFGLVVLPLRAHNNYFLPGDAFFSITLTRELMEKWMKSDEATFEFAYDRFNGEFFACGSIGYTSLVVDGITPELRRALTEAYWRFASGTAPAYQLIDDDKGQLVQTNGVVALIYNKDFKVEQAALGLKFNEDWNDQGAGQYGGYIDAIEAVTRDWRGAKDIAPLNVREKPSATAHLADNYEVAHTMESSLHIGGKEIMIALVGKTDYQGFGTMSTCPELKAIFKSEHGASYTLVKEGAFREFSCNEDGVWNAEAVKLPIPSGESRVPEKVVAPVVK